MDIGIPLVFRHARWNVGVLAWAVTLIVTLALLAFVAWSFIGTGAPRLDGPELAPFRWGPQEFFA